MKLSKVSQLILVSVFGLVLATFLSGCLYVTVDFIYVACSSGTGGAGQIQIFAVDSESGALRPSGTTVPTGGSTPVSLATTADYSNLYVANQSNKSVVHFAIDGFGQLTQKDMVTAPFVPTSIAVNTAGTYLYVAGYLPVTGGPTQARLAVYPLSSGTLGTLASNTSLTLSGYGGDSILATSVTSLANNAGVYVTAYDQSAYNPGGTVTSSANPGWVFGFAVGSTGALTPANGSPYQAGVKPTAIAADPRNLFVYVTDYASNELIGYTVESGTTLDFMLNGPFKTGSEPSALVIDPRGIYIYVTDALQSQISGYTITLSNGTPSINGAGQAAYSTDSQPVGILVDPALGRFLYTANYLGNSISGARLDPNTGSLTPNQATPYPTGANPAAIAAIPHGNHAIEIVTP